MTAVKDSSIGLYLKSLRKEKGLTIKQAAKIADISGAHISRLETGVRVHPKLDTLTKLSNTYEVELEEVLKSCGYM